MACGQCDWATPVVTKDMLDTLTDAQNTILDCTISGLSMSRKSAHDNYMNKCKIRGAVNYACSELANKGFIVVK